MNYAIVDLKAMISDIVSAVGASVVVEAMTPYWNGVDESDIPGFVADYLKTEVDDSDFDAILEEIYVEFYNIAADNNYTITTFDQ